ncbi:MULTISPECIES: hypothetical protein [Streptomyces]|nr:MULTISPECIES: hypothetical protein [Streptomyces]
MNEALRHRRPAASPPPTPPPSAAPSAPLSAFTADPAEEGPR